MIFIDCEQGTQEWFQARAGVITASMFSEVRKRLKSGPNKGDYSAAAHNYAFKLAVERINGCSVDHDEYETWAMRRGKELEHDVRILHERRLGGVFIEQAGVALTDDRKFGYSTDGFIGDDGSAEYKCFLDGSKVRPMLFEAATEEVIDQVQGGLWITGRKWCDACLYYPSLKKVNLDLTITRVFRDEDYIQELEADLLLFDALVESYIERIDELANANAIKAGIVEAKAILEATHLAAPPITEAEIEDIF